MYSLVENQIKKDDVFKNGLLDFNEHQCQICFENLTNQSIKLNCEHEFCYDCLLESYRGTNCNFNGVRHHRICPLCRKVAPYLPLRDGITPIKGIHKEYGNKIVNIDFIQCKGIIKSGPNKNKQCKCRAKFNSEYCGRHKINNI